MIFNRLFGVNSNFDEGAKTNAVQDSKSLRMSIDYVVIKAAWEEYSRIKARDEAYDDDVSEVTPAWKALEKLEQYKGKFERFMPEEKHLLLALKRGFLMYADVLHVLIDHHNDTEAAKELFETYPQLHKLIPKDYDNEEHLIEVIIEIVRDYQWQLEHFSIKHRDAINKALGDDSIVE